MNTKTTRAIVGAVVAMSLMANAVMAQQADADKPQKKFSETRDPVVTESTTTNGITSLRVASADGKELATYNIDLRTHYKPATKASENIRRWESYKFGAFVCYSLNTFVGDEFAQGPASLYRPSKLNVPSWAKLFRQAGMGYAVLTTRHTSEFLLWPSKTSTQTVAATVEPTDVVKAFVESCRKEGVAPGLYYCMWNKGEHARATIMAQLYELAHNYGPIPYFWIDLLQCAPNDLSPQTVYDLLKSLQPDCIVILNQGIQDGSGIVYFPTDVMNGENLLPPVGGHQKERTVEGVKYYLPMECDLVSQSWDQGNSGAPGSWFTYGAGLKVPPSAPKPAAQLVKHFRAAYRLGASNVLLSFAPDHSGIYRPEDCAMILELKKAIDDPSMYPAALNLNLNAKVTASNIYRNDPTYGPASAVDDHSATRWATDDGTTSAWLEVDLGKPETLGRAVIEQAYPELKRIRKFAIEYQHGDEWKTCYQGENPGARLDFTFGPVSARRVRLNVIESTDGPTISEFQVYPPATGK